MRIERSIFAAMAKQKATNVSVRLQRRGRPGFAPEFPVCRPKKRFFQPTTNAREGEFIGRLKNVNQVFLRPHASVLVRAAGQ